MALSIAKCIGNRKNFTHFANLFCENVPEKENEFERAGKCNKTVSKRDARRAGSAAGEQVRVKAIKDCGSY